MATLPFCTVDADKVAVADRIIGLHCCTCLGAALDKISEKFACIDQDGDLSNDDGSVFNDDDGLHRGPLLGSVDFDAFNKRKPRTSSNNSNKVFFTGKSDFRNTKFHQSKSSVDLKSLPNDQERFDIKNIANLLMMQRQNSEPSLKLEQRILHSQSSGEDTDSARPRRSRPKNILSSRAGLGFGRSFESYNSAPPSPHCITFGQTMTTSLENVPKKTLCRHSSLGSTPGPTSLQVQTVTKYRHAASFGSAESVNKDASLVQKSNDEVFIGQRSPRIRRQQKFGDSQSKKAFHKTCLAAKSFLQSWIRGQVSGL